MDRRPSSSLNERRGIDLFGLFEDSCGLPVCLRPSNEARGSPIVAACSTTTIHYIRDGHSPFCNLSTLQIMPNAQAEVLKAEGNAFFKGGQYQEAIAKYKEAVAIDASIPSYWSNMAACHEKVREYDEMAEAGRQCILADKKFVKGYFRLAVAQKALNDLPSCIKTLESGLNIQSSNPDLKRMKKEVTELQRGDQVAAYCSKAGELMQNGDIAGAMKTLDLASRLDAGNPDIDSMMKKIKPKWEASEKKRKSSLKPVEKHKEQGDERYKNADFEGAVTHYTKCIDQLVKEGNGGSDLALKAYSNRAGMYDHLMKCKVNPLSHLVSLIASLDSFSLL
jgi:stress-induced-phosphoprotein 1